MRPTKKASTQSPETSIDPQLWDHDKTMPHHRYGVKEYFPIFVRGVPEA
jgi:hypothetical protein